MRAAGLLIALCACGPAPKKEATVTKPSDSASASDDGTLVARIRAGLASKVAPSGLAAFVGRPALFDTTAGGDAAILEHVDLAADPDHPDEHFDRARTRAVVYWSRPVPGRNPHVVGVQAGDDGTARVFFGVILPPG